MSRSHCLTSEELTALNLGDLPETVLDELSEHLEHCPRCEGAARSLDRVSDPLLQALRASAALAPDVVDQPPARIGDYEILGELGRGGMGVVYRARHQGLGRVAALKMLLLGEYSDPQERARFRTEAESAARLQHPNIVQVYEIGEHEARPYFTQEYVEGGSLAQRLAGRPQPPPQVTTWMEPLARAVHYAHQHGVVHRDLKPSNVLLTPDNQPKLCDFGVAKVLTGSELKTRSGVLVGTVEYMAPEQAEGRSDIGPAADVYALGALLYTLLVGRPPLQGASLLDTLAQVIHQEPVSLRRLQPGVPRDLETICLKCLQKEPRKRYASAEALADDLRRFRRNEPIQARPVGRLERLLKWTRRQPAVASLLATVVLVTVVGFALVLWQWAEAVEQHQRADDRAAAEAKARTDEAAARAEAVKAAESAKAAQREAERLLTGEMLGQATTLCERGEVGLGMLTFARALEVASRARDTDLERVARHNLALWQPQLIRPRGKFAHADWVTAVALSKDGRKVATASHDQTARLWDAVTGQPIGAPLQHRYPVWAVAFSPDDQTLLTGAGSKDGRAGEVCRWQAATGKPLGEPLDQRTKVHTVAFRADGQQFLTVSWLEAQLWDTTTAQRRGPALRHELPAPSVKKFPPPVKAGALSPDGKWVLTGGGYDKTARLWDAASGALRATLPHADAVEAVAFSPDSATALTGSWDKTARLWDTTTGLPRAFVLQHRGPVLVVTFGPDGRQVATGSLLPERDAEGHPAGAARLWDVATGQPVGQPLPHPRAVRALALTPAGYLLTGAEDRCARLFAVASGQLIGQPLLHEGSVLSCALSKEGQLALTGAAGFGDSQAARLWGLPPAPRAGASWSASAEETWQLACSRDGTTLVTGGRDGVVRLWDPRSGRSLGEPMRENTWITALTLSRDDQKLAVAWGKSVRVWDRAAGRLLHTWQFETNIRNLAFAPDQRTLLVAVNDGTVHCRDAGGAGAAVGTPLVHKSPFRAGCLAPAGQTVVTVTEDGWVRRWDWKAGRLVSAVQQSEPSLYAAIAPDTRSVLTVRRGPHVQLWAVADGRPQGPPLSQRALAVSALGFSDEGETLLTGADDGMVRLWDRATSRLLGPPLAHRGGVTALAFVPGSQDVVTAEKDGPVRLRCLPAPVAADAPSVRRWVEALTGLEFDAYGSPRELGPAALVHRRQGLDKLPGLAVPD